MRTLLLSICLIVGFTNSLLAETRDQGKNVSDWHVYTKTKGEITNGTFNSIIFSGEQMKTGYRVELSHKEATKIKWEMEFTEFYAVYLEVETTNGLRTLRYSSLDTDIGKKSGYINFGLGSNSRKMYTAVNRDVQKDVEKFESGNKLIAIKAMLIRGSGSIGNLKTISNLEEKVIEDAENGLEKWNIFTKTKGTVSEFEHQVKLSGQGLKTGYALSFPKVNKDFTTVSWDMKYSEDYVVYILVNTTTGAKYLRYSSLNYDKGAHGKYISHGLGSSSKDGNWHTFRRNLQRDLDDYDYAKESKILSINAFMIKGSGLVDNIKLLKQDITQIPSLDRFNSKKFDELLQKEVNRDDINFKSIYDTDDKRIKYIKYSNASDDSSYIVLFALSANQKELYAIDVYYSMDISHLMVDIGFNSAHTKMTVSVTYDMSENPSISIYTYPLQDI